MVSEYFYRRVASPVHIQKLIPMMAKGDKSLRELAQDIGMAYPNLTRCMQDAMKEGFITATKDKNSLNFELTDKGKALVEICRGLRIIIEEWNGEESLEELRNLDFGEKVVKKAQPDIDTSGDIVKKPEVKRKWKRKKKDTL